jgi:hypothetical protein
MNRELNTERQRQTIPVVWDFHFRIFTPSNVVTGDYRSAYLAGIALPMPQEGMMTKTSIGRLGILVLLLVSGLGTVAEAATCYDYVIISGASSQIDNEIYVFRGFNDGKPAYVPDNQVAGVGWQNGRWEIIDATGTFYYNNTNSPTPPSSGWVAVGGGAAPILLSGGGECSVSAVAITVEGDAADFFDVVLAGGGGETVVAGDLPLAAIHAVGDAVTGGSPTGPIHVYVYSLDTTTRPETLALVDHWMAPGYYVVRLSFGSTAHNFRFQLTPAE